MGNLKGASLGYAPVLLANIRLGWKGLPATNTLADYKHLKITDVKRFITLGPVDVVQREYSPVALC